LRIMFQMAFQVNDLWLAYTFVSGLALLLWR
jgi:hypothetical protein